MRESIAISHTLFNVVNTIIGAAIWLRSAGDADRAGRRSDRSKRLAFIDYKVIGMAAIGLATQELARMTEIAMQMTRTTELLLKNHTDKGNTHLKQRKHHDYL